MQESRERLSAKCAMHYLTEDQINDVPCRFDVHRELKVRRLYKDPVTLVKLM